LNWYRFGYWSSTGNCFDIGNATSAALTRFEARQAERYPGDAFPNAAGNGPLMRLAPIPIAYASATDAAMVAAALSARTTHGARSAIDASCYFAAMLVGALAGASKVSLLASASGHGQIDDLHAEIAAVVAGSYLSRRPPEIRGGGYVVDSLEAALWAVATHDDFPSAVLGAANLGDDADTTAAIAGQLAGAIYGVEAIPASWRRKLHRHDEIVIVADALHDLDPDDVVTLGALAQLATGSRHDASQGG